MDKQIVGTGVKVLLSLLICFLVHYAIVSYTSFGDSLTALGYNLFQFYGLGIVFSLVIFVAIVGIKGSLPQHLGFVFIGFITMRLVASYLLAQAGLDNEGVDMAFKSNFLISVLVFLAGDGYFAYYILNNKVSSEKS
ncbi:hypothetical protein VSO92_05985 [Myroides pelagicus]|uniref:hypothetical protein n=1 Tax=Myroides pelagicus TaxID=270914 RepID=UPI002DBFB822|nr:hypothetical protein [Myroides pelagicus]MEC4113657.1 hypothetical protein [Myroides pelagicus]